ncbi:MAG: hypothetical protein IPH26_09200 [Sterolibacteriaceae bacterium]|uniref:Uncharacterized protein n=1 Tax=Candidatus Methylophosphatis roskildensis TaxID=2899263 RepID=A0A9D7HKI9_9PROT|nr:hypothetical protein [Candidatus Methylophosphatis roskildensis]
MMQIGGANDWIPPMDTIALLMNGANPRISQGSGPRQTVLADLYDRSGECALSVGMDRFKKLGFEKAAGKAGGVSDGWMIPSGHQCRYAHSQCV